MSLSKTSEKVLILGGAGFIGFNLAKYLSENTNHQITIADNLSRGTHDDDFSSLINKSGIRFIESDFTLSKSFTVLDDEYDQVYMLASIVGVDNTLSMPHEVIRVNTQLILNTLEWIKESNITKVLFTSTSENYAGTIDEFGFTIPTPENIPLSIPDIKHPRYTYAVTKMLGESAFLNYSKAFDFKCTIVRYHNVFGPRMGFSHVIPNLVDRFMHGNEDPFMMQGHDQTRTFCYITDAIEATILAMESKKTHGEIYHIGADKEITIETLIKKCGEFFNYQGTYEPAPTFPGSTQRRCPDISKAFDHFSYKPKINWKDGLEITLAWYQDFFMNKGRKYESH